MYVTSSRADVNLTNISKDKKQKKQLANSVGRLRLERYPTALKPKQAQRKKSSDPQHTKPHSA